MEVKKGNDVTQYFLYCNTLIKVLLLHKHYENILQFLEDFALRAKSQREHMQLYLATIPCQCYVAR